MGVYDNSSVDFFSKKAIFETPRVGPIFHTFREKSTKVAGFSCVFLQPGFREVFECIL